MSKQQQVLVRLPEDLAARFANLVAPSQRSRFLVDLLRRELDRDSTELVQAALKLNEIEANQPLLATEAHEWVNSDLVDDDDAGFDAEVFAPQFQLVERNTCACRKKTEPHNTQPNHPS